MSFFSRLLLVYEIQFTVDFFFFVILKRQFVFDVLNMLHWFNHNGRKYGIERNNQRNIVLFKLRKMKLLEMCADNAMEIEWEKNWRLWGGSNARTQLEPFMGIVARTNEYDMAWVGLIWLGVMCITLLKLNSTKMSEHAFASLVTLSLWVSL